MSKQVKRAQPTLYIQSNLKQLELESSLKALLAIQAAGLIVKQATTKYGIIIFFYLVEVIKDNNIFEY